MSATTPAKSCGREAYQEAVRREDAARREISISVSQRGVLGVPFAGAQNVRPVRSSRDNARDRYLRLIEAGKKAKVTQAKLTADKKIEEYKSSGTRTLFWMGVATKICLLAMMALFGTSSLLPIVSSSPNWLPWTALGVSIVFGVIVRGKLEMSIQQRETDFNALVHYRELLDQPETTSSMEPRSKCDLDLDQRFKSERKLGRTARSRDLDDLLTQPPRPLGAVGPDGKTLLPRGLADAGAKVGRVLSYYNLDVDPRIAKAYVAADHYKILQRGHKQWKSLQEDVEIARNACEQGFVVSYRRDMNQVRAAAYAMPTPFTQWSGREKGFVFAPSHVWLDKDELGVIPLKYLKNIEGQLFERLTLLEEKLFMSQGVLLQSTFVNSGALNFRQWFRDKEGFSQLIIQRRGLDPLIRSEIRSLIEEERLLIERFEEAIENHYANFLQKSAQELLSIAKSLDIPFNFANLEGNDLSNDANFNAHVKTYRELQLRLQNAANSCKQSEANCTPQFVSCMQDLVRFHAQCVELAFVARGRRAAANAPAPQQRSLCQRCARVWSAIRQAISFSTPSEPFEHETADLLRTLPEARLTEAGLRQKGKLTKDLRLISLTGRAQVLRTNELMKKIDQANVNNYYTKEVVLGFLVVSVLCFVEYFYFSNPWVIFGVNAAFLAMIPARMLMEKRMKDLDGEKDRLRVLEGLQRGPGLLLNPSKYPAYLEGIQRSPEALYDGPLGPQPIRSDKRVADSLGVDVPAGSLSHLMDKPLPKALVNFPRY